MGKGGEEKKHPQTFVLNGSLILLNSPFLVFLNLGWHLVSPGQEENVHFPDFLPFVEGFP